MTTVMTRTAQIIISPCISFPLITEHFTHIILFALDSIVCELEVWVALVYIFQRDSAFSTNYWQLNGNTVHTQQHSLAPYFILYSLILPNPPNKIIRLEIYLKNTDPELLHPPMIPFFRSSVSILL